MPDEPTAFEGGRYLIDASAWGRSSHPAVAAEWERAALAGQFVICAPFMVEALYSARNAEEYGALDEELRFGFDHAVANEASWSLALSAQRALANVDPSFHRRPPIDLLIAAVAHQHGVGVLHYDSDYDVIEENTQLDFKSRWLAPRGAL